MRYKLSFVILIAGVFAFLQENQSHILADTLSTAWQRPKLEARAAEGARFLRGVYETTPEQTIHFDSVIASSDGDVCYFARTTDARQTSELVFAFFEHGAKGVRYSLEFSDVQGVCDGPGSRDFTVFVDGSL